MDRIIEVKIVGWFQVAVWVAIMLIGYFLNRAEIRFLAVYTHTAVDEERQGNEQLRAQIKAIQEQNKALCLQYNKDMDAYFRTRPEFKRHPWACDVN